LDGLADGFAADDAGGDFFDRVGSLAFDGTFAVNGLAEHVHHAPKEALADGDLEQLAGGTDLVAFVDLGVVAEDNGADFGAFEIQSQAGHAVAEVEHLVELGAAEALNFSDAITDLADGADILLGSSGAGGLDLGFNFFE